MHLELGPLAAGDVQQWSRFARRVVCELRTDPADLEGVATADLLGGWTEMIDRWEHDAAMGASDFRWSGDVDVERAEYLLHGLDRIMHSDSVRARLSTEDREQHSAFTMHLVQSFVDGLSVEGRCHQHYVDQVRGSMGAQLDH